MPLVDGKKCLCAFLASALCFKADKAGCGTYTHLQRRVLSADGSSALLFMAAVRSRCGHYIFVLWFLLPFYSAPHCKFRWRPILECRAVTLPRRETHWNFLGCPKLANRSQLLVGRTSPYCEDMGRHCCLWSPCGIGQVTGHYIFALLFLLSFFFSSPNLSRRRLDVCHTSTHGVALVRI